MSQVPSSLEAAITEAKIATQKALEDGLRRIQVELLIPEIALQAQALALQFAELLAEYGSGLKVIFPDTGAAALARRDWGETTFNVTDLGSRFTSVEAKVSPEDKAFLVVCPSSMEVQSVEKLCELARERPVILLIPQLEDVSIVGIGYAARQLRARFLSTLVSCYYFRPLEGAVVLKSYPGLWQVWLEKEENYELIAEESQKPMGETLDLLIAGKSSQNNELEATPKPKSPGLLTNLQRFLKALSQ
jgi:hypothetical protein